MGDLGFGWEQMPNFKVHSEADEEHSDMFLEDLERFATGDKEAEVYRAAKESMELLKIFRYGIAKEMERLNGCYSEEPCDEESDAAGLSMTWLRTSLK